MSTLGAVLEEVQEEADKAAAKFGHQYQLTDLEWQSILLEEVGEAAMLVTKGSVRPITDVYLVQHPDELRAEIVQIAAVAMRWIATIDDRKRSR